MLNQIVAGAIAAALLHAPAVAAAPAKPAAAPAKVGALAIDRAKGFIYGFSHDHATRAEAEARALEEVEKRGGRGSVVLVWAGSGCGAYRTIAPEDGNAYGWGVAATQVEAQAIADREVAKRANGKIAMEHVWACNSSTPRKLKVLKDASDENFRTVRIGSQVWTAENLTITHFRNGEPIPQVPSAAELRKLSIQKKPASFCYASDPGCSKYGRFYNLWAVIDPRGFAPEGWRVPSADDFTALFNAAGGIDGALPRLRTADGWPDYADPLAAPTGFDAVPAGYPENSKPRFDETYFWTNSSITEADGDVWRNHAILSASSGSDLARIGTQSGNEPHAVRLIAE